MDALEVSWHSSMESGIPIIDFEHKELVEQLAALIEESGADKVEEMLRFLKEYAVKHFAHEQVLHKNSGYPKAAEHKALHTAFVHAFVDLEEEYLEKGNNPEILQKLVAMVAEWLIKHIMGEDRKFAEYYAKVAKKMRIDDGVLRAR